VDGEPKYLYGSAGGLYPIQTYAYAKPGRVAQLEGGLYYYDPGRHGLVLLAAGPCITTEAYDPLVNGPVFGAAGFALYFIVDMRAIGPMYGERSLHYATIECGLMAQLLEMSAPAYGIGLCQIGNMQFDRIRDLFLLGDNHVQLYSMLGGAACRGTGKNDTTPDCHGDFGVPGRQWDEGEL
jgi:SagB-type dehydrogenase family enzyme